VVNLIKFQFKVAYPCSLTNKLNNGRTLPLFGCASGRGQGLCGRGAHPFTVSTVSVPWSACNPSTRPSVHMKESSPMESPLAFKRSNA